MDETTHRWDIASLGESGKVATCSRVGPPPSGSRPSFAKAFIRLTGRDEIIELEQLAGWAVARFYGRKVRSPQGGVPANGREGPNQSGLYG